MLRHDQDERDWLFGSTLTTGVAYPERRPESAIRRHLQPTIRTPTSQVDAEREGC
ncbi:hypothetical protein [Telmatospirillum sp. J64-1]|uniref:hypothetical protein n=1 Tax=Telmatospirillum sp. J64-1 TaxID=2502183 RepID=UPI00163DC232|nr:hypothetical protein [Telmatospirillum sp. J64-1]